MLAYIVRRVLLMIPTLLGIMFISFVIVQFAPGGPVERILAQLQGTDAGATSRIAGGASGDFGGGQGAQPGANADATSSRYRGAQGLDPAFIKNLGLIGIQARSRIVDAAQYQRRENEFDFDVVSRRYGAGLTPGEPLRQIFGSRSADIKGSQNIAGVAHPAVDALLENIVTAKSRDELRVACRALDRVLRAGRYWVPMWYSATHRIAYWDMFGRPERLPKYDLGVPAIWWHDADKAKRIGRA